MRAVVTGCAGFIGSHLADRLIADKWTVIGLDSLAPTYDSVRRRRQIDWLAQSPMFEFIEGDLNSIDLKEVVGSADVVFHLAARPGVRASWRDFRQVSDDNIRATQRVLDAITDNPETRLVFASSSSVYGVVDSFPVSESTVLRPISPYGVTKAASESLVTAYAAQFDLAATSLRYFTVYGPRQRSDMAFNRWIRAALLSQPLHVFGDGKVIRDFTYVDDVVEASVLAGTATSTGHQIYNVAGGSPASVNEILTGISELLETDLKIEYSDPARGDPPRTGGDTKLIESDLGWHPRTALRDGLEAQVGWLRAIIGSR